MDEDVIGAKIVDAAGRLIEVVFVIAIESVIERRSTGQMRWKNRQWRRRLRWRRCGSRGDRRCGYGSRWEGAGGSAHRGRRRSCRRRGRGVRRGLRGRRGESRGGACGSMFQGVQARREALELRTQGMDLLSSCIVGLFRCGCCASYRGLSKTYRCAGQKEKDEKNSHGASDRSHSKPQKPPGNRAPPVLNAFFMQVALESVRAQMPLA